MGRDSNRLSAIKVSKLVAPGRYSDGQNLWLQVSKGGTKSWLFRYMKDGKARHMGLGPLHTVGLAEARDRAQRARLILLDGLDPLQDRRAKRAALKAEAAARVSFKQAAERYIAAHSPSWKNPKHSTQWPNSLETYAYPLIGELGIGTIETRHVMSVIEPIWMSKTETATRVRGRLERILDWARAMGMRSGENPARWRGHLDKLLPARSKVSKVKHHAAMSYRDVPAFLGRLRDVDYISARALELTILCATRTNETIGATWDEIDLVDKIWTIPGTRMKSGRVHRIPLSECALRLLRALPREVGNNAFVFPGARSGAALSNMAMLELLRGTPGASGLTVHGFRSSFREWAGEQTNFARETIEASLAHQLEDKVEAAYMRSDLILKRRKLMEAWASYCERTTSSVVSLCSDRTYSPRVVAS